MIIATHLGIRLENMIVLVIAVAVTIGGIALQVSILVWHTSAKVATVILVLVVSVLILIVSILVVVPIGGISTIRTTIGSETIVVVIVAIEVHVVVVAIIPR